IVSQEESQRTLGVTDTHREPLTMLAGKGQNFRPRKPEICDYCGYKEHQKENFFKIIGYPPDFKSKRKNQTTGGKAYANNANANTTTAKEEKAMPTMQAPGKFFTEEQYKQLVNLLSKPNAGECSANMTGIISLLSSADMCNWVIDSGATHLVTYYKDVLKDIKSADSQRIQGVQVPIGNKSKITQTGNTTILENKTVKNILYVPDFKFNLLSMSKLTKDLWCSVTFSLDFCIFQDLYSGRVMG
ncbi:hypothetical protein A4A49_59611, partial [Nicotiana attenuata]